MRRLSNTQTGIKIKTSNGIIWNSKRRFR